MSSDCLVSFGSCATARGQCRSSTYKTEAAGSWFASIALPRKGWAWSELPNSSVVELDRTLQQRCPRVNPLAPLPFYTLRAAFRLRRANMYDTSNDYHGLWQNGRSRESLVYTNCEQVWTFYYVCSLLLTIGILLFVAFVRVVMETVYRYLVFKSKATVILLVHRVLLHMISIVLSL